MRGRTRRPHDRPQPCRSRSPHSASLHAGYGPEIRRMQGGQRGMISAQMGGQIRASVHRQRCGRRIRPPRGAKHFSRGQTANAALIPGVDFSTLWRTGWRLLSSPSKEGAERRKGARAAGIAPIRPRRASLIGLRGEAGVIRACLRVSDVSVETVRQNCRKDRRAAPVSRPVRSRCRCGTVRQRRASARPRRQDHRR